MRSEWFKNALKANRFEEGRKGEVKLPEDDPDVFEAFVYFLFGEKLLFKAPDHMDAKERDRCLELSFRIWSFGDKYLYPQLQNAAMHSACNLMDDRLFEYCLHVTTIGDCYKATRPGSPLRVLLGDYFVNRVEMDGENFDIDEKIASCPGFLSDIHASETAFHALARPDFSRFTRPSKFVDTLFVQHERQSWEHNCHDVESVWDNPRGVCTDCGFTYDNVQRFCKACVQEQCSCDKADWAFLCRLCRPQGAEGESDGEMDE